MLATKLDPLILDIDATLTTSHSEKELATGNYKGGFGHAPMLVSLDYSKDNGTGEVLVAELGAGSKTANNAKDHIRVLDTERILVRTDSAGASREFLNHLHSL